MHYRNGFFDGMKIGMVMRNYKNNNCSIKRYVFTKKLFNFKYIMTSLHSERAGRSLLAPYRLSMLHEKA